MTFTRLPILDIFPGKLIILLLEVLPYNSLGFFLEWPSTITTSSLSSNFKLCSVTCFLLRSKRVFNLFCFKSLGTESQIREDGVPGRGLYAKKKL